MNILTIIWTKILKFIEDKENLQEHVDVGDQIQVEEPIEVGEQIDVESSLTIQSTIRQMRLNSTTITLLILGILIMFFSSY